MGIFGRGRQQPEEDENSQETIHQTQPPTDTSKPPQSVSFETVLGPGTLFRGNLASPGSVRLEGDFEGNIQLEGNALIGEHARITADMTAANVTIAGAVRGNISGQRVQLLRTGRVWGDIEASSISTEDGAFIRGTITMKGGDIPPIFDEMEAALTAPAPPLDLPEEPAALSIGEEPEEIDAEEPIDEGIEEITPDETVDEVIEEVEEDLEEIEEPPTDDEPEVEEDQADEDDGET